VTRRRVDDELLDRALRQPEPAQNELMDLLEISRALTDAFDVPPRPAAVREGRAAAIAAFDAPVPVPGRAPARTPHMVSPWEWLPNLRVRALASAAVIIGILGTLIAGAHGSLPGDALYGVKLGVEEVRLVAAVDSIDEARVHLDVAAARIDEVQVAKRTGRTDAMRESLRRYTEAIIAVGEELTSGDLSTTEARIVLAEAADAVDSHQEILIDLRPGTPPPAKPDLEDAILTLSEIVLPPAPPPEDDASPTPGPSSTTPTESPSPSVSPSPSGSVEPSPEPSDSPAPDESTPAPNESPSSDPGTGSEGGSAAGSEPTDEGTAPDAVPSPNVA
jgi:hypothetical protein